MLGLLVVILSVGIDRPHFLSLGIESVLRRVRNHHPFCWGEGMTHESGGGCFDGELFFEYGLIDMNHGFIYYMYFTFAHLHMVHSN